MHDDTSNPTNVTTAGDATAGSEPAVATRPVRFPAATSDGGASETLPLARFYDVNVSITAELGRATLRLSELMKLGVGSVVELGRLVDQPVDILAQGVRLGRGDVVTVKDQYGIRITELERLDQSADGQRPGGR